ncbi:acyl-CoA N-acyltransferase [Dichomitus squalens]|nr:acyl-CoA N-acyltransferase [Dichomitus squalens]
MSYVNNYTPQPEPTVPDSELYGPDPYDINFAWPLHPQSLQTPRLKLVPFVPREHAATYWASVKDHLPTLFRYFPFRPHTLPEFLAWLELACRRNPFQTFLAVLDTTRPDPAHPAWGGCLAGALALCNTAPGNLSTEPGYLVVFPEFQHTHVAKEMVALVLRYLLALPGASPPGLGFRRVQWCAHPGNAPSIGLAERMGFRREGTLRWLWVLPEHLAEAGEECTREDAFAGRPGRHTAVLSVCWDDWEGGVNEKVEAFLAQ